MNTAAKTVQNSQRMDGGLRSVVIASILLYLLPLLPLQALAVSSADKTSLDSYPLRPADTASPRATLESFQEFVRESVRRFRARLPPAYVDQALSKALDTFDLSGLPPHERLDLGAERAVLLMEILSRIDLPPLEKIPDAAAVKASGLARWTIPDTEITIARTEKGPHAGDFQFTKYTVQELPAFYEAVKHLPPRQGSLGSLAGFYNQWSHGPGPWIPVRWTTNLPAFLYIIIWHQAVWQWLASLGVVALTLVVILLAYRLARRIDGLPVNEREQGHLARLIAMIVATVLLELATRFVDNAINLTGQRLFLVNGVLRVAYYGAAGWMIILALDLLGAAFVRLRDSRPGSIDAALVRVVVRLLAIITVVFMAVWVADQFGLPAAPLIASLGIGGLAIALAVRPTLENVIGGFILFADKPVRVGDFCRYGDDIGTVEEIGLRSTKIRSLERTTVTVPNAELSQMKLDNFAKRDMRLLNTVLQLRYETTPEQMRWILARLRELLVGHPMVTPEPARARFIDFGPYSKNVEIFAYIRCQDQDTFLAIKEDILLRIENIVAEAGSGFAFPSQTTYFSPDGGLDDERKSAAEAQVGSWRARGNLPFPDFEEHERDMLKDVLDYPPKGSPHYEPPRSSAERQLARASSTFALEDLADLPGLVAKLRAGTSLANHLLSQFSAEARERLSNYEGGVDADLAKALVGDLNVVVCGPSLYEKDRFEKIELSADALELLKLAPKGEDLRRLNMLLLQDAYPSELSRRRW